MTNVEKIIDKIGGREKIKAAIVILWLLILTVVSILTSISDSYFEVNISDNSNGVGKILHDLGVIWSGSIVSLFVLYLSGNRPKKEPLSPDSLAMVQKGLDQAKSGELVNGPDLEADKRNFDSYEFNKSHDSVASFITMQENPDGNRTLVMSKEVMEAGRRASGINYGKKNTYD